MISNLQLIQMFPSISVFSENKQADIKSNIVYEGSFLF